MREAASLPPPRQETYFRVLPRSTSEQKAQYLVHQLASKTKLSKHTTHHPLINVLQPNLPR